MNSGRIRGVFNSVGFAYNPTRNDQGQPNLAAAGTGNKGIVALGKSTNDLSPFESQFCINRRRKKLGGAIHEAKVPT